MALSESRERIHVSCLPNKASVSSSRYDLASRITSVSVANSPEEWLHPHPVRHFMCQKIVDTLVFWGCCSERKLRKRGWGCLSVCLCGPLRPRAVALPSVRIGM